MIRFVSFCAMNDRMNTERKSCTNRKVFNNSVSQVFKYTRHHRKGEVMLKNICISFSTNMQKISVLLPSTLSMDTSYIPRQILDKLSIWKTDSIVIWFDKGIFFDKEQFRYFFIVSSKEHNFSLDKTVEINILF